MKEPGLYPIIPKTTKAVVFLDKGRPNPVLKITREFFLLTPAFGMTAHASQGQTFGAGAVVDLRIGGSSSAMSSYVALTRVKAREDLFILRPFPRTPFIQGHTWIRAAVAKMAWRFH